MEMDSELQRILNENTLLKSQNQTLQNEIARVQRELSTAQAARHKAEQQTEQTTATLRAARKDWKKWKSWWMEQSQKLRPYLEAVAVSPCRIQQSDGPPTTTKKRKFSSDAPASASEAMPLMSKTPLQATAPVPAPKASSSTQAPHLILHSRPQANHRPDLTVLVEDTQFSHPYGLPQPQPRQLVTRDHESSTDSRSEHNHQSGQAMTEPQNAGTHTQLELPARAPPSDSSATYESPSQPEASLEQHYLQNQQELHGPASQDDKRIETQTKASPVAQPNSRGKLGPSSAQPKSGNSLSFAPVRSRNQEDLPQTNRQARRSLDSARSNGPTQSPLRSPPKKARPCNQKSARPFARDLKENDVNATPKGTSQPRRPQTLPVEGSSKEVKAESPDASILMWRDERGSGGTGRKRKPEASEVDTADVSYEKMMDSIRKKRKQEIQADPLKYKGRGAYAKGMPVYVVPSYATHSLQAG